MLIVNKLVEAISNEDMEAFGALYAKDAVLSEPLYPERVVGQEAIKDGEAGLFNAFGSVSVDVKNEVSFDSGVMAEVVLRATNDGPLDLGEGEMPPTGRSIEVRWCGSWN